MLNNLPIELLDNIIYNINTTEDILNIRLVNKNFYNLLREIPIYKYDKLIYNIIFNSNNIKKYHNDELMKEIVFKSFSDILSLVSGQYYPPRSKKILNLINRIKKTKYNKSTLGGCVIEKKDDFLIISKETKVRSVTY